LRIDCNSDFGSGDAASGDPASGYRESNEIGSTCVGAGARVISEGSIAPMPIAGSGSVDAESAMSAGATSQRRSRAAPGRRRSISW